MLVSKNFSDLIAFTRASARWHLNSAGVLVQDAANVPTLDFDPVTLAPRGFLLEEARTNVVRNGQATGATAGANAGLGGPGVLPTYWQRQQGLGNSVEAEVLGSGTVNGIGYVDLRFNGTTANANGYLLRPDGAPASLTAGQQIALSCWHQLLAGTAPGIKVQLGYIFYDAGSTILSSGSVSGLASLPGTLTRTSFMTPVAPANTASCLVRFELAGVSAVTAYNFDLRIGGAQAEVGLFPTSYILTTSAQVTRAADSAIISSLSALSVNPANCTVFAEFVMPPIVAGKWPGLFQFDNGSSASRVGLYVNGANGRVSFLSRNAGVDGTGIAYAGVLPGAGTTVKVALRVSGTDAAMSVNGAAASSIAYTPVPGLTRLRLGQFDDVLSSCIRRFNILPVTAANADLQTMTA